MASVSDVAVEETTFEPAQNPPGSAKAEFVDRWIWVFMAALFIVTVLTGFIPDSLTKLEAIRIGQRAPFPPVMHVHAVLMGSWLMLLLAQTSLMATGRRGMHMQLGIASVILAPAIVVAGFILVPVNYHQFLAGMQAAPPEVAAELETVRMFITNIMLEQIRIGILFPLFVALALLARKRDPGLHKRLMILATALPLPAATDRITWLPHTLPNSPLTIDLYMLALVAPLFLWDLYRQGRIHKAYIIWFAINLPFVIVIHALWNSDWWLATAPVLLGAGT